MTSATFSPCRRYRYRLARNWDESKPTVVFCGLNPSTADETADDPTIRREVGFAKEWGFGTLVKVNAYAWRSTDPKGLWLAEEPCGEDNLGHIVEVAKTADLFVAAWGNNIRRDREAEVVAVLLGASVPVHALKITKAGNPSHTLYLPKTLRPFVWRSVELGRQVSGLGGRW